MQTRHRGPADAADETPRHRALATASRVAILRLVRSAGAGLTAADVVAQVGLHPSTVRAHLEQMVDAGLLIKARASDGSPGRPAWRYRAAADPAPGPYRALAAALLDHLATTGGGVAAATEAGQAWGRRLGAEVPPPAGSPVDAAMHVLRALGFDPRQHPKGGQGTREVAIHLYACPFLDLVGGRPDVVCGLHAGLIAGVVQGAGAPETRVMLEPFGAPNACLARLRPPKPRGRGVRR